MIIPSINRNTFAKAKEDIEKANQFVPTGGWLHLDIADGKFTPWRSWNNPDEFGAIDTSLNVEAHLMVENVEEAASLWLRAGVKRLIVPVQQVKSWDKLKDICERYGAELAPSFDMSVAISDVSEYAWAKYINVLSVHPGESGQIAHEDAFDKVGFLRQVLPGAKIEFDGGVNLSVGKHAKESGADVLISGHYIFESDNPKGAFEELSSL